MLTQAWAGTYATELLALLGAEVIQLEVRGRLDSWRGTYQNPIPKNLSDSENARHAWNLSPLYNSVNLNKQCITVDLNTKAGVEIFKGLVSQVDFVAENFSPRVMAKLGLDYPKLQQLNPDLVMASLSAYGATGPWAPVPGIGGTIEPSSGMSALLIALILKRRDDLGRQRSFLPAGIEHRPRGRRRLLNRTDEPARIRRRHRHADARRNGGRADRLGAGHAPGLHQARPAL